MSDFLFVYGTLLAVAQHPMGDLLRAKGRFVGRGSIQARLYIIDDPDAPGRNFYPGAVPSANPHERVFGEVHEVLDRDVFEAFDRFEACAPGDTEPYEFLRRPVRVTLEVGQELWARSYLYTWDVATAEYVPRGRYTEVSPDV
ncbi:MAG: gamma-glutamylcyclotransferase family protein, partial [Pseudomonadota bacterium]